jgi:hypothetical protein
MDDPAVRVRVWRTSSKCNESECVEVGFGDDRVWVRSAGKPDRAPVGFTRPAWAAFLDGLRRGEFSSRRGR